MIYLGIDPGIQRVGFCALKAAGSKFEIVDMGTWHLVSHSSRPSIETRLEKLYQSLSELLEKIKPDVVGLEKVVSFKNISSAHVLSEARGVIRLSLHQNRKDSTTPLKLWELSPTAIKKIATGFGSADKRGIFKAMLLRMPGLGQSLKKVPEEILTHDTLDALAIAWCAMIEERNHKRLSGRRVGPKPAPLKEFGEQSHGL